MPRDPRPFITVHDGMPEHPKIEAISDAAFRLLVSTWCWCNRNRTDGMVAQASWDKRGTAKARRELLACGLAQAVDGGVQMHDYLDHQRSAAEIDELSAKRREAGKKGGKAKASAMASASHVAKQTASKTVAEQEEELARDTSSKSARARATRIPDNWAPSSADVAWQRGQQIPDDVARRELPKFRDYWAGVSGERGRKADWPATWRNWLRRVVENTPKPRAVGDFGPEINTWTPEAPA